MRISVIVKANSRENIVEKLGDREFAVRVKAQAKEGKANEAVIKALAEFFGIAKSRIDIIKGLTGKKKLVDII
jgi:uncharacterized protein